MKTKIILLVGRKDFPMKNFIRKKSISSTTPSKQGFDSATSLDIGIVDGSKLMEDVVLPDD